ncbi:MAG: transcription termination/antitermination protein NusG [Chloroflexia bacterium]
MNTGAEAAKATAPDDRWYVVYCKPGREAYAANALGELLGLDTYMPRVNRPSGSRPQSVAFFPGYLFVRANLREVNQSSINSTPGVIKLLYLGDAPQWLPSRVIDAIRERVDALNAEGGLPKYTFHTGDQVLLTDGALKGLQAVFLEPMSGRARVKVLLEFLGRSNEVQVDVDMLEPAGDKAPPTPRGTRTTRGRGRRIKS